MQIIWKNLILIIFFKILYRMYEWEDDICVCVNIRLIYPNYFLYIMIVTDIKWIASYHKRHKPLQKST